MKKIILSLCVLAMSSHVHAATLQDLGVSKSDIAELETNPQCVVISGEQFDYAHGNSHVVRGNGKKMRLMVYQDAPPFEALAVIIDDGKVSRKVVQVDLCATAQKDTTPDDSKSHLQTVVVATAPATVRQDESIQITSAPITPESPEQLDASGGERKVYMRGALKSIDTFNVSWAKYSPFNGEDKERHGESVNIKARFRPVQVGDLRLGVYGTYTDGESDTYRRSKDYWSYYDYTIYGGGISGLYDHGDYRTSEMDIGLLWQETDGWIPSKNFGSWQEENQWELRYKFASSNGRENGELWFPYWETGLHYIHPFNVEYGDTKGQGDNYAYDNRRFRIWGMTDIYDWYLGDANQWRLSPTLNSEIGYLWGKESAYLQGGLGAKLGWRGQELFELKILNPRLMFEENGSRIYDYIGTWKVDNTFRAISAEQVSDYKPGGEGEVVVVNSP